MDWGALRGLTHDVGFATFGVPATVTRPAPNNTPVATTGIWLRPLDEPQPYGRELRQRDPRKVLAFRRTTEVPDVPRKTVIVAPELAGQAPKTWRVEEVLEPIEVDQVRVAVVQTA